MYPQERQVRVRYRVDEVRNVIRLGIRQLKILSAEGNDLHVDVHPGHFRQAVRLQARTGHQAAAGIEGLGCANVHPV